MVAQSLLSLTLGYLNYLPVNVFISKEMCSGILSSGITMSQGIEKHNLNGMPEKAIIFSVNLS